MTARRSCTAAAAILSPLALRLLYAIVRVGERTFVSRHAHVGVGQLEGHGGGSMTLVWEEVTCKSALNRVNAPSMPFRWSLNPYRGCSHACVYCYSRSYHPWLERDPGWEFDTRILVKVNIARVLRQELARPGWKREKVAIGTAVDPYQPVEGRYKLTRHCLQALLDYDTPASITTKNTMVWRDVDLLKQLAQGPGCLVNVSITTLDPELADRIEPGTSPPLRRLEIMQRLVEAGIPAGVMLAPILPGITDDPKHLQAIVQAAADHKAAFLYPGVLRLEGACAAIFRAFLTNQHPELVPRYDQLYDRRTTPPARYQERLEEQIAFWSRRFGIGTSPEAQRALQHYPRRFTVESPRQLALSFV